MTSPTFLTPPTRPGDRPSLRESINDAAGYWEPRRIGYNGALALLLIGWIVLTWPHFEPSMTFESAGKLLILGILANICYSAAYVVDVPLSRSDFKVRWERWRVLLWVAGTLFAVVIAHYWIGDEIYPYV